MCTDAPLPQMAAATIGPGIHCFAAAADLSAGGTLTLSGAGLYIFRVPTALTANVGSTVLLNRDSHMYQLLEPAPVKQLLDDHRKGKQDNHKVLLNELDNLPPERRAEVVGKQRRIIAAVENLVREIRPDVGDAGLAITMLFFGMINWTHTWFRPDGRITAERLAELAVDLMLSGLERVHAS